MNVDTRNGHIRQKVCVQTVIIKVPIRVSIGKIMLTAIDAETFLNTDMVLVSNSGKDSTNSKVVSVPFVVNHLEET